MASDLKALVQENESPEDLLKRAQSLVNPELKSDIATSLLRAIKNKSVDADIYHELAKLLLSLERLEEAKNLGKQMVVLWPLSEWSHFYLAFALWKLKQYEESEKSFKEALLIKPDMAIAIENLYVMYKKLGYLEKIDSLLEQAKEDLRNVDQTETLRNLTLPLIASSTIQIEERRARFIAEIEKMRLKKNILYKHIDTISLGYQNMSNKTVLMSVSQLIREQVPEVNFSVERTFQSNQKIGVKIKIGFISDYFYDNHSIGKLYGGLLKKLDREFFEVIIFQGPDMEKGASTSWVKGHSDKQIALPRTLKSQQRVIADENLQVLYFLDRDYYSTYLLSFSRLAPVQLTSWGRPDTSGVDTLDYFISSKLIEREDAQDDYSESLVLFSRLPCYYYSRTIPKKIYSRQVFGLPEKARLYGCPQALFKFHPDFDKILAQIAEGDPEGYIVVIEGTHNSWTELLKERWAMNFPILNERVIFLKRQTQEQYMMLLSHFDVLLDPIHFGSGNTFYESMVYGTPNVTWPGRFMRGRIVAGAYHQMGIENPPIAASLEDYASLALSLAKDTDRLKIMKRQFSKAARKYLFTDKLYIREFEDFIKSALNERITFYSSRSNDGIKLGVSTNKGFTN